MKFFRLSPLFFCLFLGFSVQAQPVHGGRILTNFDEDWKFAFGHAADPARDFNFTVANIFSKTGKAEATAIDPRFDDSQWRKLNLPHDWAVELPFVKVDNFDVIAHGYKPVGGLFPETSIGWYRKTFEIPAADSGYRYSIRFDGVFRDAKFWINGFYLGTNESGYIGISYDITDYIRFGKSNTLVVRADASQYEGWFYEGAGIYRHVWLTRTNNLHVAENGIFIYSDIGTASAEVTVETTVEDQSPDQSDYSITTIITDRDGKEIVRSVTPIDAGAYNFSTSQHLNISAPQLWSPDYPYLYRAITIIRNDEGEADRVITRFGIRKLEITADKGLILNGKPVKIKGVNCHQDHAGIGTALPDYLQFYRIGQLKKYGVNAYRTSHNPPTPELLDACDSLGMLILDETRLLNSSPEYMAQFERLIRRDRSRASVFLWSIGNEEQYVQTTGEGKRIALAMMAKLKELDPTRTCTYAADLANIFQGINEVIPVRGFNYREYAIIAYHNDHPDQPVTGTEMGSTVTTRGIWEKDTIRCYLPDQDLTAPWWASTAEAWWPIAATNDWMSGGFVWTGFDYRGEPTPFQWPNINSHFGFLDVCGFPKNLAFYYKSWWSDEDVIHLSPHWNWPGMEGHTMTVWVNSNTETVELFLNGKSLGSKPMPRNSHLNWEVPYKPGILEAVGIRDGKKIRTKMETTGLPVRIRIETDKTNLLSDGTDATVVNISVTDSKGSEVPDAQNLIRFSVEGDARIIGVGNGDPSSHEPDKCADGRWQRHLFNGKCQLILLAGKTGGPVKLVAMSEGLETGEQRLEMKE
ncbi:MAG: beta-galactosidase GalA [Bacteroidota bacterium]